MLVYLTGISGAGKSTVGEELSRLGYESHDVDAEGFAAHFDLASGEMVTHCDRSEEFHRAHRWLLIRERVERLAETSSGRTVFLCGVGSNEEELLDLFDLVIALRIDERRMRRRLAARENNEFGKSEHELATVLGWHANLDDYYKGRDWVFIDSGQPLAMVVEKVLAAVRIKSASENQRQTPSIGA